MGVIKGDDMTEAAGAGLDTLAPLDIMSRRDGVMQRIRRAIVMGTLKPGEKLTENRLAASLNVSRPTMREALMQLAQEGLIIQEPYKGLRVADLDPKDILDIASTRIALDTLAVTEILADPTDRRLAMVRTAWSAYDRLPFDADPVVAHEAHIAFHRSLWVASENTLLLRLWPVIEAHLTIALARDQATRDDPRRAHDVHEAMVDAIEARDMTAVAAALDAHTMRSARELVAILEGNALAPTRT